MKANTSRKLEALDGVVSRFFSEILLRRDFSEIEALVAGSFPDWAKYSAGYRVLLVHYFMIATGRVSCTAPEASACFTLLKVLDFATWDKV